MEKQSIEGRPITISDIGEEVYVHPKGPLVEHPNANIESGRLYSWSKTRITIVTSFRFIRAKPEHVCWIDPERSQWDQIPEAVCKKIEKQKMSDDYYSKPPTTRT